VKIEFLIGVELAGFSGTKKLYQRNPVYLTPIEIAQEISLTLKKKKAGVIYYLPFPHSRISTIKIHKNRTTLKLAASHREY